MSRDFGSIESILRWFKEAKPNPTHEDQSVQLGVHIEEFVEIGTTLLVAIKFVGHRGSLDGDIPTITAHPILVGLTLGDLTVDGNVSIFKHESLGAIGILDHEVDADGQWQAVANLALKGEFAASDGRLGNGLLIVMAHGHELHHGAIVEPRDVTLDLVLTGIATTNEHAQQACE